MAYTELQSGEIQEGTQYYTGKQTLGDYDFYLQFDATGDTTTVVARCDSPDGIRAAASKTFPGGSQILGWSIEANETEASVYVSTHREQADVDTGGIAKPVPKASTVHLARLPIVEGEYEDEIWLTADAVTAQRYNNNRSHWAVMASSNPNSTYHYLEKRRGEIDYEADYRLQRSYIFNGLTVYYAVDTSGWANKIVVCEPVEAQGSNPNYAGIAWDMIYGVDEPKDEDVLVARFAIDIGDAGGYPGGGGGWISPGDWNIDPTTTLHLTVNGALSGRHNDPLDDPSYSYLPADNTAEAGYGCGGDGGHGGGGGGGASTIIVRQFATNKANSKDIMALAKRHGYGSGGGKGASGGDGCILVYY